MLMPPATAAGVNPVIAKLDGLAPRGAADRALLRAVTAERRLVAPASDLIRQGEPCLLYTSPSPRD